MNDNHSDTNLTVRWLFHNARSHVVFKACRQNEENEELEYNYGDEMAPWRNSKTCTKTRGNGDSESEEESPLTLKALALSRKNAQKKGNMPAHPKV